MKVTMKDKDLGLKAEITFEKDPVLKGVYNLKVDGNTAMVVELNPLHRCVTGELLDMHGNRRLLVSLDDGHIIHDVRKS